MARCISTEPFLTIKRTGVVMTAADILSQNLDPAGCLYRLTFPSGKCYIGITNKTAKARFAKHRSASDCGGTSAVQRAIRKYGSASVAVETLAVGPWSYIKDMEVRAIAAFGTRYPDGYNLTDGGDGTVGYVHSPEMRARNSAAQTGKTASESTRAKMRAARANYVATPEEMAAVSAKISAALKGVPKSAESIRKNRLSKIGRKLSDETRIKMSAARMGNKNSLGCKQSDETKMKKSIAGTGRVQSAETIAKRVATMAAKKLARLAAA